MPHVTKHTPKVSTWSVNPYARESSREKRQQDRRSNRQTDGRTDRQTHRRIVQNHFSRRFEDCTSQIRSYLEVDFLHGANTSIDMEVKLIFFLGMKAQQGKRVIWYFWTLMKNYTEGELSTRSFHLYCCW